MTHLSGFENTGKKYHNRPTADYKFSTSKMCSAKFSYSRTISIYRRADSHPDFSSPSASRAITSASVSGSDILPGTSESVSPRVFEDPIKQNHPGFRVIHQESLIHFELLSSSVCRRRRQFPNLVPLQALHIGRFLILASDSPLFDF